MPRARHSRSYAGACSYSRPKSASNLIRALARGAAIWVALCALPFLAHAVQGGADGAPLPQTEPELRQVVQQAISQAGCFSDRFDSAVWFTLMEPKLRRYVSDPDQRLEILRSVYCETHHGRQSLPPGLVMAVLDVESRFDPWAVSSAGAVGLMQVMPFWPERLGMRRYQLTRVGANIHMGCAILRYYMLDERRDIRRALQRYNGSVGHRDYADRVIVRWTTYWTGADDLGAPRRTAAATVSRF